MTREQRMNKRKETGKTYVYRPNPFEKGTKEYQKEAKERALKNVSHKTPYARMVSLMDKLDNQLAKEKEERSKRKMKTANV